MQKYLYEDLYHLENTHWWHIRKRELVINLLKSLGLGRTSRVLDVGCGTGRLLEELGNAKFNAWGIDVSKDALAYCRKRKLSNVSLGSAERSKFKDGFFDAVLMLDVLEHTDDSESLKEAKRILKKTGTLILTVPAYQFMWSRWDEVLYHKRRYDRRMIERLAASEGFKLSKLSYFNSFALLPAYVVRKFKTFIQPRGASYSSDFKISNHFINGVLLAISRVENFMVEKFYVPTGLSILAIFTKK